MEYDCALYCLKSIWKEVGLCVEAQVVDVKDVLFAALTNHHSKH